MNNIFTQIKILCRLVACAPRLNQQRRQRRRLAVPNINVSVNVNVSVDVDVNGDARAFLSRNLLYFFNLTQLSQLISEYLIVWQISHGAQDVHNVLTREANKSPEPIPILSPLLPLVSASQYLFLFQIPSSNWEYAAVNVYSTHTLGLFVYNLRLYEMGILYYLMIIYTFITPITK